MALKDIQTKINALAEESKVIAAKADLADADLVRIEEISAEGQRLQKQMDALKKAGEFGEWAGKSAGMLSLASGQTGGATLQGMRPAGETVIEQAVKSVLVNSEGEGVLDERTLKVLRDPDYSKAFKTYLRVGLHGMTESRGLKALQEGSDTAGGFMVPEDLLNRIVQRKPTPTRVAARVTRFNTSRDSVVMPKINYTADNIYTTGMRVTWTGEVPDSSTKHRATEPVFGQTRIPVFTAMMSLPLTNDLVEDAAFDLVGWCSGKFGETNDLVRDDMAINGTGAGQPYGILANPGAADNPAVTNSGVADAVAWEGLQDITFDIPEQYDDNVVWLFNRSSTAKGIAKLVDGNGRPLWTNGAQDNGLVGSSRQTQLLGYPVMNSAFMPDVAANAHPIILGDLQGYFMVDRIGFSMQVLRELYSETNQIVLLGRTRFGGLVAEPFRMRIQKIAA